MKRLIFGRTFMGLIGAAGLLTAACTAPAAPSGGTGATADGPAQPKVNRVVMAVNPPTSENNDPRGDRGPTNWVHRPYYEYLVGVDPENGKYSPQLATSWKLEPDGRSFRFKLRTGVPFHHGKGEFGADALIDTFKLQTRDPQIEGVNATSNIYNLLNPLIDRIEKTAADEAVMHLKTTDGTFMLTISEQRGVFYMISAQHFNELNPPTWQTGPAAGTGPYQYKERAQAQYFRYERVPYKHWRLTPDFPEFEFRFMKEASTRMASLLAGEVHMADLPSDLQTEAVGRGFKLLAGKVPGLRSMIKIWCCHLNDPKDLNSGWQHPESPLADVRVRRALSKAIDRTQINKAFFRGQGDLIYNIHFHPTRQGWDPSWERRFQDHLGFDVEAAKKLLADAGYGPNNPMETNILFPTESYGYSGGEDIMDAIAGMWRNIGVKVNYQTIEPAQRTQRSNAFSLFNHLVLGGTASDSWTGITTYGSTQGTSKGTGIELPEADRVLARIRNTVEAGEALFTGVREIPLLWIPVETTVDPKIVADYQFPGAITGAWTHVFNIKAAR